MTWTATDSETIDFEFAAGQMKGHVIGANSEPITAQSLTDLENYFGAAVKVMPTPDAGEDDTAIVTAKVAEVAANGGGVLFFLPGVYRFNEVIPCSGLWVRGSGWTTIFKRTTGGSGNQGLWNVDYLGTQRDDLRFSDFKLDGDKAVSAHGRGINIEKTMRCIVDHVWCVGCHEGGINIGGQNTSNTIGKIWITDCLAEDNGAPPNGWGNISCTGGDEILIAHNQTTNDSGDSANGINCETNNLWNMSRVHINNNKVRNGIIKCVSVAGGSLTDLMMIGNEVDARNHPGNGYALGFDGLATGRVRILSNDIFAPSGVSAGINCGGDAPDLIVGENNIIGIPDSQGTFRTAVGLYYYSSVRAVVRNNSFAAASNTHATYGAWIVPYDSGTWDRTKAFNNTFSPEIIVPIMTNAGDVRCYQADDVVLTANLPAAAVERSGLRLIEDAGSGVFKIVYYVGAAIKKVTLA